MRKHLSTSGAAIFEARGAELVGHNGCGNCPVTVPAHHSAQGFQQHGASVFPPDRPVHVGRDCLADLYLQGCQKRQARTADVDDSGRVRHRKAVFSQSDQVGIHDVCKSHFATAFRRGSEFWHIALSGVSIPRAI